MHRIIFTDKAKLNENKYTLGSGVTSVSTSNRSVLKRRAATNLCCTNAKINIPKKKIRFINVRFRVIDGIIQMSQLAVYSNNINVAPLTGIAQAANTYGFGSSIDYPIDGTLSVRAFPFIYHSYESSGLDQLSGFGYWLLDLQTEYVVDRIVYYNRDVITERANGMFIETYDKNYDVNLPDASVPINQFILNSDLIQTFNLL